MMTPIEKEASAGVFPTTKMIDRDAVDQHESDIFSVFIQSAHAL